MAYIYDFPDVDIAVSAEGLDVAHRIGRELDEALRGVLGVRGEGYITVGQPHVRYEDGSAVTEPRDMRPSLVETSAVMHAIEAFRQARGLPGSDMVDLPVHLEELKQSIAKVEAVTERSEP